MIKKLIHPVKPWLLLYISVFMMIPQMVVGQLNLAMGVTDLQKQIEAGEIHEALTTINSIIASNHPTGWMYYMRGVIYFDLNDRRSAVENLRQAKQMGYNPGKDVVNYLIFPEYLANEVARGFTNEPLTAENGYKIHFTRKDSLQGGMRQERSCFDVFFYDLKVRVIPRENAISGSNTVYFKVVSDTKRIQVDLFTELSIQHIRWHGQELGYTRDCNAVFIDFPSLLKQGCSDSLTITYSGKPHIAINPPWNGGLVWSKKKGKDWIGVACEHFGASCWWPNKDVLADRPDSMQISITVPKDLQGIANGNLRHTYSSGEEKTFVWFVSYPITNYLVTFYAGDFIDLHKTYQSQVIRDTMSLDFYVTPQSEHNAIEYYNQTETILNTYEKLFGPYPFRRDGVAMVEAPYKGMENQSAIAIGDEYGKKNRRVYDKCDYDYLLVHETAHEWWGNSVGMHEMADAWISEGFATYTECLFMEQVYGYKQYMNLVVSDMGNILNIWPVAGITGVNDNTFLGEDIYDKGAVMLHNLRCFLNNDSLFFGLIRNFYRRNVYNTVTTHDFIYFANNYTGKNLTPLLGKFLFEKDPPILNYRFVRDGNDILLSYRWIEVDEGFEMPFLLFTSDGRQMRLEGSTRYHAVILKNTGSFLVANFIWYPKNSILKNSLTYFQTSLSDWQPALEYYSNGKMHRKAYMSEDEITGSNFEYYPDETMKKRSYYENGRLNGEVSCVSVTGVKTIVENYKQDTLEGNFNSYYENGSPEAEGKYSKGMQTGIWKFYNPSGNLCASGEFEMGSEKKDSWKYFNRQGKEISTDSVQSIVNTPPHYFGGEEGMYDFIKKHLPRQSLDNRPDFTGTVFISFLVSPNGSLSSFKAERSSSEELTRLFMESLKQMPRWAPGYLNGDPCTVRVVLPFKISHILGSR